MQRDCRGIATFAATFQRLVNQPCRQDQPFQQLFLNTLFHITIAVCCAKMFFDFNTVLEAHGSGSMMPLQSGDFPDGPTVLRRVTRPQPACRLVSASSLEGLLTRHFTGVLHFGKLLLSVITRRQDQVA